MANTEPHIAIQDMQPLMDAIRELGSNIRGAILEEILVDVDLVLSEWRYTKECLEEYENLLDNLPEED